LLIGEGMLGEGQVAKRKIKKSLERPRPSKRDVAGALPLVRPGFKKVRYGRRGSIGERVDQG